VFDRSTFKIDHIGLALLIAFLLISILIIYQDEHPQSNVPERISVGVLPDQTDTDLQLRYGPLLAHLSEYTGIPHDLIIPGDYSELVDLFINQEIELAYFGGLTYLQAAEYGGALPLVSRDVDLDFESVVVVRTRSTAMSLADLRGMSFAFGSRQSTSGHLMPRYFFEAQDIEAETYFNDISYSGKHDRTISMVLQGEVDAGVVNGEIVESLISSGRIQGDAIRIIWKSPPYVDYVWAIQQTLDDAHVSKLRDAFLVLGDDDPTILSLMGARAFLPVNERDFQILRNVAIKNDLLKHGDDAP